MPTRKRVDDCAAVHTRAVIAFDQQRNAASSFQMARPRERVIELCNSLNSNCDFSSGDTSATLLAAVDTIVM